MNNILLLIIHIIIIQSSLASDNLFNYKVSNEQSFVLDNGNKFNFHVHHHGNINKRQLDEFMSSRQFENYNNVESNYNKDETYLQNNDQSHLQPNNFKQYEQKNEHCLYMNIQARLSDCFGNSTDCKYDYFIR